MKYSRYNFFMKASDGKILAFNALTGAFVRMDRREHRILAAFKTAEHSVSGKLLRELTASGLVVDDNVDEVRYLRVRNRIARYQSNVAGLTIAPTLDCNFQCTYCFQDRKTTYMSEVVAEAVIRYLESKLKGGVRTVNVTWYGGEPFLPKAFKTVILLSAAFRKLCRKFDARYAFALVSNGSLLNQEMARELRRDRCTSVQITIDGPPEVHDKRRPFLSGRGSFAQVIENIQGAKKILPIRIRVNVDRQNQESCLLLLDHLRDLDLKKYVSLYYAPVEVYSPVCKSIRHQCLVRKEFSNVQIRLYQETLGAGFNIVPFPHTTAAACGAECVSSILIEPSGLLQKCWNAIGVDSGAVGHLLDKDTNRELLSNYLMWLDWDIFKEKKCVRCKILPVCMGSCLYKKLSTAGRALECPPWRHNLKNMLSLYYSSWKAERESRA